MKFITSPPSLQHDAGGYRTALKGLSQFHENAAVIAWWQAVLAPALRWLTPFRRRTLLALGAVYIGIVEPLDIMEHAKGVTVPDSALGSALVIGALFAILWLCYLAAVNFAKLPQAIRRRPQITLHLFFWSLLAVLWFTSPEEGPWRAVLTGIAVVFPFLLWRCGYLLLSGQRGRAAGTRFADHLIYLWPAYGGSNTPYGKGLDYLSRNEAKTESDLARAQLAGIKLLVLALLWRGVIVLMDGAIYAEPGNAVTQALGGYGLAIPRLSRLLEGKASASLLVAWASVYCELIWQVLQHAARGHVIIAVLRLFGFNVFRNTYKPLLSQSIVEFWNRYYYYFKELLSEFFFFPTFARRFKQWPRLRLFAAVFAAAFVGNMYYHILLREELVVLGNWAAVWQTFHSRFFYCLLLAIGIFVSMLREQSRSGGTAVASPVRRLIKIAGVWTFFALIFIWNAKAGASFTPRVTFFLGLFGLG